MKRSKALIVIIGLLIGVLIGFGPRLKQSQNRRQEAVRAQETIGAIVRDTILLHGTVIENVYVNPTFHIRAQCPEDWWFLSEKEIAQRNQLSSEHFSGTLMEKAIEKSGQFIEMCMYDRNGNNLSLMIQPSNLGFLSDSSDEKLAENLEPFLRNNWEAAGYKVLVYETLPLTLSGKERTALHIRCDLDGVEADQYQIWFRDVEDYMASLTLTLWDPELLQTVLDGISIGK